MSIWRRIAHLYDVKVSALLHRAGDPREALDYCYRQQQELLRRLRSDLAGVAATRTRAGLRESQLRHTAARLGRQAQQAVPAGEEELARRSLALRTAALARADELQAGQAAVRDDEEKLSTAVLRLQAKAEAFAVHKEAVKARYSAAEATGNAGQLSGGIWAELDRLEQAIRRAEAVTARIEARASALGSLIAAAGALADVTGARAAGDDEIQAQLDAAANRAAAEAELARLKAQLAAKLRARPGNRARSA